MMDAIQDVLLCERCGKPSAEHAHSDSPVPAPEPSATCAGYVGYGPASVARSAPETQEQS